MSEKDNDEISISFTINGETRETTIEPNRMLLDLIREDLGLTGTKYGCGTGDCGVCTVLINGEPEKSCIKPAKEVDGAEIVTIEGLSGENNGLHPIQEAFIEAGAVQCGYCTPAMILVTKSFLEKNPDPDREEAREAISEVLCRCTGYQKIIDSVILAAEKMRE
ncbi:MAG: (2Fe-2S)-binding protein [Hadesarchaea archaeon]|nr:(2Fe-2S)-binding protein [Hadesarchaea archaeon]